MVTVSRSGNERSHRYASDDGLEPGTVLRLDDRDWLVETVEETGERPRAVAKPARYRLRLVYPDGVEQFGAFRPYRRDAPRLGHTFTTVEDGQPAGWAVVGVSVVHDEGGEPYLDLSAERNYTEAEELEDHELEHRLERGSAGAEAAATMFARADRSGLAVELVGLDPGELPDWDAARQSIDLLILEEIAQLLIELCGVDPDRDPRETWLARVQERLRRDLESLVADVEGAHDVVEEWELPDGRILAAVGGFDDEANPDSGFGWLRRLNESGALRAAGFSTVRKPELQLPE